MTRRRKQKRRIRERMARTGESYSSARASLLTRARASVAGAPVMMVPVTDMPRAIAFYRDALGFPLKYRSEDETWAQVGDEQTTLGLHPGDVRTGVDTGLGLRVADLGATCRLVTSHGGRVHSGASNSAPVVTIEDPDGNLIRLMHAVEP